MEIVKTGCQEFTSASTCAAMLSTSHGGGGVPADGGGGSHCARTSASRPSRESSRQHERYEATGTIDALRPPSVCMLLISKEPATYARSIHPRSA